MIKIDNLTKIYNTNKKSPCEALHNINLNIQDKGLVFILGKSGSGKSTLLNLIGGLDNITSGSIVVDGNDISKFNEGKYCDYRNNHIGFIFQDYHLIEELSVYDNIALSLNLIKEEDNGKIIEALKKVELEGYENRFPNELSGGERQRVAIARAIVKNPAVILADEPTGNLDTQTSTSIISLLKEISKDCLILIVSHNVVDAYKYADRIIELSKGEIIKDQTRNIDFKDNIEVSNNKLFIPDDHKLSDDDITNINNELINNNFKEIVKVKDKYIKTNNIDIDSLEKNIDNKSLSLKNLTKLSFKFLKSKIIRIVLSSIMVSAIMLILALAQTIVTFNSGQIMMNEMSKYDASTSLAFKTMTPAEEEFATEDYIREIEDTDIQKFYDAGYKGEIMPVYNYTIPVNTTYGFAGLNTNRFVDGIYVRESLGTLAVNEEFLKSKVTDFKYLAKTEESHEAGFIITDYLADAIIKYGIGKKAKNYEELLGVYDYANFGRLYIEGIIYTGYKEKYNDLFEKIKKLNTSTLSTIYEDKEYMEFTKDVYDFLGLSFICTNNIENDILQSNLPELLYHHQLSFNGLPYFTISSCTITNDSKTSYDLQDNEILMNVTKYNELFNTNYTSETIKDFIPYEVTLNQYRYYDYAMENPLFSQKVKIVGLYDNSFKMTTLIVSDNIFDLFKPNNVFVKGLYFNGTEGLDNVIEISEELNYEHQMIALEAVHTMTKAVEVFIPIFRLITFVLCLAVILILINFSTKMVKDKYHDIGIMKALGTKNLSISSIFGLQILLIVVVTSIASGVGYLFFIDLANDVLIESLKILAKGHTMFDLDFLLFDFKICMINTGVIMLLGIVSLIIPMLKIKNIKPVKIIKVKE